MIALSGGKWWKRQKGLDPVWTDGDPYIDPPDYVTLRGERVPTPEKLRDDLPKKRWKDFKHKVWSEYDEEETVITSLALWGEMIEITGKRNDNPHLGKWSEDSDVEKYEKAASGR